jgi:hypothetical protein
LSELEIPSATAFTSLALAAHSYDKFDVLKPASDAEDITNFMESLVFFLFCFQLETL